MTKPIAIVRFAFGLSGNIISLLMFGYPWIAVRQIQIIRSVGQSSPYSYLVTLGNCFAWVLGCLISIVYISIYFRFSNHTRRQKLVCWLILEVVILAVLTTAVFYFGHDYHERSTIVGVICIISNIGAYIPEIFIMILVIKTKSVEQMPLVATLLFFASSVVWCAFSVIITVDPFILTTYAIGSLVATVELIVHVYIIFPSVAYRVMLRLVRHLSC